MINLADCIVICDRCGKIIDENNQVWFINQLAEYGSIYDGDFISKEICDDCLENFLSSFK